jgi:ABC-2 type transport system ATP-binding protein
MYRQDLGRKLPETLPVITFDGLSKQYSEFVAVRGLAFSVQRGEVFGFLGPNGAGKTTTIRMLMGILVPTAGRASIAGLDCQRDRVEVKRRVGYLPDAPIFYDFLRGREILEFVGEMHGQSHGAAVANAARLHDELALAEAAEEYAINYSMGMKKKLGLACALIHDPPVRSTPRIIPTPDQPDVRGYKSRRSLAVPRW